MLRILDFLTQTKVMSRSCARAFRCKVNKPMNIKVNMNERILAEVAGVARRPA